MKLVIDIMVAGVTKEELELIAAYVQRKALDATHEGLENLNIYRANTMMALSKVVE